MINEYQYSGIKSSAKINFVVHNKSNNRIGIFVQSE